MARLKWVRDGYHQKTGDGRFVIGGVIWTAVGSRYVRLFDTRTGREYPCRTEASAKAAARNLMTAGPTQTEG